MSKVFDAMRRAVKASGRTQGPLADDAVIDRAQFSRFIAGKSGASVEALERLANVLQLEIIIRPKRKGR